MRKTIINGICSVISAGVLLFGIAAHAAAPPGVKVTLRLSCALNAQQTIDWLKADYGETATDETVIVPKGDNTPERVITRYENPTTGTYTILEMSTDKAKVCILYSGKAAGVEG